MDGAIQAYTEAARLAKATESIFLAVSALAAQGDALIELSRLHQAVETYEEALQLATLPDGMPLPAAGKVYVCLGKVFYEWNDLEAVTRFMCRGIELCRQEGTVEHLASGYTILIRVRLAQGDPEGARKALSEAERLMHNLPIEAVSSVDAWRARLWLAQGDLEMAARWARQSGLQIDDPISFTREAEYIALAHVLLAQGDLDAAITLLSRLLHAAGRIGRVMCAGLLGFGLSFVGIAGAQGFLNSYSQLLPADALQEADAIPELGNLAFNLIAHCSTWPLGRWVAGSVEPFSIPTVRPSRSRCSTCENNLL